MHANFAAALNLTLKFEGGWVDNKHDPGGSTNMGITLSTLAKYRGTPVTSEDIRCLLREEATDIYRHMFWDPVHADDFSAGLDIAIFDYAVNSGLSAAVRGLQTVLDVRADGILGPDTLNCLPHMPAPDLIKALSDQRLNFLKRLSTFRWFGTGWTARVKAVESEALHSASLTRIASTHLS